MTDTERKTISEIEDRIDGCVFELDAHLHPQNGKNLSRAAVLQGWIFALSWSIGDEDPYDRSDEILELLDRDRYTDMDTERDRDD